LPRNSNHIRRRPVQPADPALFPDSWIGWSSQPMEGEVNSPDWQVEPADGG
jgi:hypothetical protein